MVDTSWSFPDFAPMEVIPTGVGLTVFSGGSDDFIATPLQAFIDADEAGQACIPTAPGLRLDRVVEALEAMENNAAAGKIVVVTWPDQGSNGRRMWPGGDRLCLQRRAQERNGGLSTATAAGVLDLVPGPGLEPGTNAP